jgi:hypothetical protein
LTTIGPKKNPPKRKQENIQRVRWKKNGGKTGTANEKHHEKDSQTTTHYQHWQNHAESTNACTQYHPSIPLFIDPGQKTNTQRNR